MTKEELQEILHELELDYEAEPTLIYLFYSTPDGRVNNFSISVRRGRRLSDRQLERLMRREDRDMTRLARLALATAERACEGGRRDDMTAVCLRVEER